jgi:hypothetical protein
MAAGKILAILAGLITLVGTYVIAIYGFGTGYVGSGIGFLLNLFGIGVATPGIFEGAANYASVLGLDVIIFYLLVILFIIFLFSGILQFIGAKSRIVGIIFSLFPIAVGTMFILIFYTEILGPISGFFALFFIGEQYGGLFPFMVDIGGSIGLGSFIILAGGVLGLISGFLPREDY